MGRLIQNIGFLGRPVRTGEVERILHGSVVHGIDLEQPLLGRTESLFAVVSQAERDSREMQLPFETIAEGIEALFAYDGAYWNGNSIVRLEYLAGLPCPWGDFSTTTPLFPFDMQVREILLVHRERGFDLSSLQERYPTVKDLRKGYPGLVADDEIMVFSELHPHLLREHHFPEGKSTPYCVDFARAKKYLGI